MYCPKCSEAQISENVRFCKRCGLRLESVQDLLAGEETSKSRADGLFPKQKDISIGAGLMYIGSLVAMLWARSHLGADGDVLPQVFLILGFTLGFILLLFHPLLSGLKRLFSDSEGGDARKESKRSSTGSKRDGVNLGALLMFLGTVKAMALSTMISDPSRRPALTVAMATVGLMILLISRWLVGGVYRMFVEDSPIDQKANSEQVTAGLSEVKGGAFKPALPPAQHNGAIPVEAFTSNKVEMVQPPSVTEKTTGLLGKQ